MKPSLVACAIATCLAACHLPGRHDVSEGDPEWEARDERFRQSFAAWVGCYELRAEPWVGGTTQLYRARFALPSHIRLDIGRHDSYMLLRPLPDPSSGYGTAGWRASGPDPQRDSLFLIWQRDARLLFGPAVHAALAPAGDSYQGTLRHATDIRGLELPFRSVVVTRTDCETQFGPPVT